MLIPCLWTTLPWIVLGQTYYMSFVFNNYGYGVRPSIVESPNLGLPNQMPKKPPKSADDTLELTSMDHSRQNKKQYVEDDAESSGSDGLNFDSPIPVNTEKLIKKRPKQKASKTPETSKCPESLKTSATSKSPEALKSSESSKSPATLKSPEASKSPESSNTTETSENADTPETPKEITTESTRAIAPATPAGPESGNTAGDKARTVEPRVWDVTWPPVTPHPPEFFQYPLAKCQEDMNLHEVFGISLERDRGLATKVLCKFNNSWGGPWLLMTRVELPVRIHMRHWFLGYVTDDYKDMNINFLGLAHIMNSMRTAMLILGQDANDRLVYNLYDDVVISAFNDIFMMRKAELVEANATDMLFLAVGKTLSSYGGRNRSCPLQVLGSWWGNKVREDMNEGFPCVFPKERSVTRPGYMAIFIKPSTFKNNNTALYNRMITTRRPWGLTVDTGLMEEVKNNKAEYEIRLNKKFLRSKQVVNDELSRRVKMFDAIEKVRRLEDEMLKGR